MQGPRISNTPPISTLFLLQHSSTAFVICSRSIRLSLSHFWSLILYLWYRKVGFKIIKMSGGGEKGSATTKTPADFLKSIRGRPVVVKLNSGVDYRGILACLDGYMNIAMEQTEEYVNGQLKNKYGDAFIRGNNVLYISTSKRTLADGA
ncbi:hypothetical protein QYF36_017891 [Acer negundo]|nr:hypothetical protein QYF36_017891 [Acer negundo]